MGCYSWFARPIIDEEFKLMHEYAAEEAAYLLINPYNEEYEIDTRLYNHIMDSIRFNKPWIENGVKLHWYVLGYGCSNPKLPNGFTTVYKDGELYVALRNENDTDVPDCCFIRPKRGVYPNKIIHNKKELRRYLRKKYFQLSQNQISQLTAFWKRYPGGILYWG